MDPKDNPAGETATATEPTQDELDWANAASDFIEEKGGAEPSREDPKDDEQAKSKEELEEGKTPEGDPEGKKSDEEPKPGDDPTKQGGANPEGQPKPGEEAEEPTVRDRLAEERELKQAREDITADVRKKLFADKPTRLEDADGDPIETIGDVVKLQNPRTGKPFTPEEAASWLLQAQNHFEKQLKADQAQIDDIVETNLAIKYDLEAIKKEYGELLAHMPKLRQRVSDAWLATAELGSDGDTIIKTKTGMKDFYDIMLAPYVKQVEQMKADQEAADKAEADKKEAAEKLKKEQDEQRKNNRSDRGDVVSTRTKIEDITDEEERGWAKAAKEYYEG